MHLLSSCVLRSFGDQKFPMAYGVHSEHMEVNNCLEEDYTLPCKQWVLNLHVDDTFVWRSNPVLLE